MGVTGLWRLIEPCGKPVPVETLEGKVLAVDISIWLHQVVKGFQDNKGSPLANAHLLGLFHRLCKLLYYRVRPIFVFDGCVPQLKRDTIARRHQQRSKLNNEAERIQALLLQSLAKEKVVQQALGPNSSDLLLSSPPKRVNKATRADDAIDDMFKLPELPAPASSTARHNDDAMGEDNEGEDCMDFSNEYSSTTEDSSFEECNLRRSYNTNLQAIDVRSDNFRHLPAEVRHEILVDIKETRKQSSWGRLHELPSRSEDFSSFQMKRLLKRRAVQETLEETEQEMGRRTLTYAELTTLFTEEGIVDPTSLEKASKQISSDENTRFLLVRNLHKMTKHAEIAEQEKKTVPKEAQSVLQVEEPTPLEDTKDSDDKVNELAALHNDVDADANNPLGDEYNADLQLAIALSLESSAIYSEKDYVYNGEGLKLNREQRKNLQNAAVGPARAYMIEYAGMNEEEVVNIMDKTQAEGSQLEESLLREMGLNTPVKEKPKSDESVQSAKEIGMAFDSASMKTDLKTVSEETLQNDLSQVCDAETHVIISDDSNLEAPTEDKQMKIAIETANLKRPELEDNTDIVCEKNAHSDVENSKQPLCDMRIVISDSDTDSDLEEVTEQEVSQQEISTSKNPVEVLVNIEESLNPQDDLFADIFKKEEAISDEEEKCQKDKIENNETKKISTDDKKSGDTNLLSILAEVKSQLHAIKDIKLENVKVESPLIDLSCDEMTKEMTKTQPELIEIYDSDDAHETRTLQSKSPKVNVTPNKSISEFFKTDYKIKRTPDKVQTEEEQVPKVKSPFFVNRSQKTKQKEAETEKTNSQTATPKAAKKLFDDNSPNGVNEDAESIPEQLNAEECIKEAAQLLKEQKSEAELQDLATNLARERRELESERNRQDRMGMSITQRMNSECQELLRLFGIPYLIAPMEAEAQCAFLDGVQLTQGTITDDSDIWLFGGRTVYKNFFAQNKHVLEFRADEIEKSFNCDRTKLIQLACLVGSDYTTGVHGIGTVTALEILASFATTSLKDSDCSDYQNLGEAYGLVLRTLSKFRDWWVANKHAGKPPGSSARLSLQKKLKNIELHEGFPSIAVAEAYLQPKIDDSKEPFTWGNPDVESIREFAKSKFGWTTSKTDDILMPVIKRINEKKSQKSIRNYFNVKSALAVRNLKVSKRVQNAIAKMAGNMDPENTEDEPTTSKRAKRTKNNKTSNKQGRKATKANKSTTEPAVGPASEESKSESEIPVLMAAKSSTVELQKKSAFFSKETIPQRERDFEQMLLNRQKAAEVLKKSASGPIKRSAFM